MISLRNALSLFLNSQQHSSTGYHIISYSEGGIPVTFGHQNNSFTPNSRRSVLRMQLFGESQEDDDLICPLLPLLFISFLNHQFMGSILSSRQLINVLK